MPTRTCIGCRRSKSQHELLRLARREDGRVGFSLLARSGRGAYVCADPRCVARAVRNGALARAFRCKVPAVQDLDELLGSGCDAIRSRLRSLETAPQLSDDGERAKLKAWLVELDKGRRPGD